MNIFPNKNKEKMNQRKADQENESKKMNQNETTIT
jgi:hypothetical protein